MSTDSDWAGDTDPRRSCSGGWIEFEGNTVAHWNKLKSNVAVSSEEAKLNAGVKGISEGIGVVKLCHEVFGGSASLAICVDASASKGMLFRTGAGQLRLQGAVQAYGVIVRKVRREASRGADLLTRWARWSSTKASSRWGSPGERRPLIMAGPPQFWQATERSVGRSARPRGGGGGGANDLHPPLNHRRTCCAQHWHLQHLLPGQNALTPCPSQVQVQVNVRKHRNMLVFRCECA